ncbi:cilia- and flagella-associated protein 61-like [Teleopsis dalmanni]|uniref:cilia- and flagella-associated protein 61-like n=1 Tax=Teleopsis dalmanni TaxID=139649 RepID=UPI0018CDD218|nr:cilia- and flagella-associated protein 61-like [Teleopsis dalmanni]
MQAVSDKPGYKRTRSYFIRNALRKDFEKLHVFANVKFIRHIGYPKRKISNKIDFFNLSSTHFFLVTESAQSAVTVGFAEFSNHPPITALPKECWEDWITTNFCLGLELSPTNSLFLSSFIYNPSHIPEMLLHVLEEIFMRELKLRYILILQMPDMTYIRPNDIPDHDWLEPFSTIYYPIVFDPICKNVQCIHVIERESIIRDITYRRALPGDNDDIIDMMDMFCPQIRTELGDFYIAEELLHNANSHSSLIVCEIKHKTIGFFWLNDNVDILKLVENFELEIFGNLVKYDPNLPTIEIQTPLRVYGKVAITKLFTVDSIKDMLQKTVMMKFFPKHKFSKISIYNKTIDVISDRGQIQDIKDERLYLFDELFKKFRKIDDKTRSNEWYMESFEALMEFYYNIPNDYDATNLAQYRPEETSNVFALQLFSLENDRDLRLFKLFLAATFSAYPDREFCIISVPKKVEKSKDLLKLTDCCVHVQSRPNCSLHDDLYIVHHSALYGELFLQQVNEIDDALVQQMLLCYESDDELYDTTAEIMCRIKEHFDADNSTISVFLVRCGKSSQHMAFNTIVGFIITRAFHDISALEQHFFIRSTEMKISTSGEILCLYLHPFYQFEYQLIFRELGRMSGFNILYYIAPNGRKLKPLLNDLVKKMQPVEPKLIKTFDITKKKYHKKKKKFHTIYDFNYADSSYAVYRRHMRETEMYGDTNIKIVIIGFTDVTKALLRSLLFSYNSQDMNCVPNFDITVITKPGIVEAEYDADFICRVCKKNCWIQFHNSNAYINDCVKRLDLQQWITFVSGDLRKIDRASHKVKLNGQCDVNYDILILCCYTDYSIPQKMILDEKFPYNYAQFNCRLDKLNFYHKLLLIKEEMDDPFTIIVYGIHVRVYEFINFLIEHGIKGKNIILVVPDNTIEVHIMNHPDIDINVENILQQMVFDLGVKICERYIFLSWQQYGRDEIIKYVTFYSLHDKAIVKLDCDMFVSFYDMHITQKFINILDAAEIYMEDNDILVDNCFRTNDKNIYVPLINFFCFGRNVNEFVKIHLATYNGIPQ